jgi:tetratricopeptide (TPR) repeat protein
VDELLALSGGHPLFLSELAAGTAATPLPRSLVDFVAGNCDGLGPAAAEMLRSAAVLGAQLDLDLLGAVLHRPVIELLADAELALARGLLVDVAGTLWFRHDLVRTALASSASAGRSALLHRELSRALQRRPDADPVEVAEHARLGGEVAVAAHHLRRAAARAGQRFDHGTAEALLDDALALDPQPDGWLQRARVRTLRGRYDGAYADVERAGSAGAAALEVGAWASYFDRRFDQAAQFAADGELSADDPAVRGRCLSVGGRTRHAAGDLAAAEAMLHEAIGLMSGPDRVSASAWLGVVRAHQSRGDEAIALLGPAARAQIGVEHTSATLHALLFTGHAHAVAGRPGPALRAFARYTEEVERRQVPRFAGRGSNFTGWVLRNVGAVEPALERHLEALELSAHEGTPELAIAAHEDLAEERLEAGDLDAAQRHLKAAEAGFSGDLVFGWRLQMKLDLLQARLALHSDDPAGALQLAERLVAEASRVGVPRYVSVARLVGHQAAARLGRPVDPTVVERHLDQLDAAVGLEAWWWTGETAAALRVPEWVRRAAGSVAALAGAADDYGDTLRAYAARRLDAWLPLSERG